MVNFFKEFWLWIVIPFVLVLGGLAALYLLSDGNAFGDFTYNVF